METARDGEIKDGVGRAGQVCVEVVLVPTGGLVVAS